MAWPTAAARTKTWGTEVLTASDLQGQFDLGFTYFNDSLNGTTGHGHTGGTNDGPKIPLTTSVTGTLPVANGGTNTTSAINTASGIVVLNGSAQIPALDGSLLTKLSLTILAAHNSSTQSINTSSWTQRTFGVVDKDSGSYWASNTYTPLIAGWYLVTYMDAIAGVSGDFQQYAIYKNGSLYAQDTASVSSSNFGSGTVTAIVQMNGTTDALTFFVWHNHGSAQNAQGTGYSFVSILRVA